MPTPVYRDHISPQDPANKRWLARTLGPISEIGEHRLTKVGKDTFDAWTAGHPDYPHPVQLDNGLLVVTVMCPPHDGAAAAIINHIRDRAVFKCYPADCKLTARTVNRLRNGVRKKGDGGLFDRTSGAQTMFPGVVVEVGYADNLKNSRRDISLWLDNSDLAVKLGIVCKIETDPPKNITCMIFEFWKYDFDHRTRTSPMRRAKKADVIDFSAYDGTAATLPATTSYDIPSYYLYSDGIYPAADPAHPNPPAQIPLATNVGRQFSLRPNQLAQVNADITLRNNQRSRIQIDLRDIADEIRSIRWDC